jgi:hypothetical protein
MSEYFVAAGETNVASGDDLESDERPAHTAVTASVSVEELRAVRGALNFLSALVAVYGELLEREGPLH